MCNACGFFCCASDVSEGCGCEHCPDPECHACAICGERDCDGDCTGSDDDYDFYDDEITRGEPPFPLARVGVAATPELPAATPTVSTGARP